VIRYALCVYDRSLNPPIRREGLAHDVWPDPSRLPREGLGAFGGPLDTATLLAAYAHGYFPCYGADTPRLWWNPEPRAVFLPGDFHASNRLARRIARGEFRLTWDTAFKAVMLGCDENRDDGSWILPDIVDAYCELHRERRAHSIEVWKGDELVGGAYGVHLGALFAAESMFHRATDASKVALGYLLTSLFAAGIEVVDVQYKTPHLASLGARELPRARYCALLPTWLTKAVEIDALPLKAPPRRIR
jgi:leucyl/phenylalanyl-tRNA---protein transferase